MALVLRNDRCCRHACNVPLGRDASQEDWGFGKFEHFFPPTSYWFCSDECYELEIDERIAEPHFKRNATVINDPSYSNTLHWEKQYGQDDTERSKRALDSEERSWHSGREFAYREARRAVDEYLLDKATEIRDAARQKEDERSKQESLASQQRAEATYWDVRRQIANERVEEARRERQREQAELDNAVLDNESALEPKQIPEPLRFEHTLIVGASGSGKSTLVQQLILNDLNREDPPALVVIDPKGELTQRIQRLALFHPEHGRLRDRIVVVDPTDRQPPALNMFDPASRWNRMWSDDTRRQVESQTLSTFGYIFSSSNFPLTQKQRVGFSYVVRLLYKMPGATVQTLLDVLDDPAKTLEAFAFKVHVESVDPMTKRFFRNEFFSEFRESKGQIKARLYSLLSHPAVVDCLAQPRRTIDFVSYLQERKIVLVNTAMPRLGKDASTLLGRYFIAETLSAAFARVAVPRTQWHPAFLYVDEFQEFADEEKTPELFRLAREYNLGVIAATQSLQGSPFTDSLRDSISTNTTIKYAASVQGTSLNYMARDMQCEPEFLIRQQKDATHVKFACFVRGMGLRHPFVVSALMGNIDREPQMDEAAHDRLMERNRSLVAAPHSPPPREPIRKKRETELQPIPKPELREEGEKAADEPKGTWRRGKIS